MELQVEKGDKVQQIVDMVQKMLDDLNRDQAMDDKDHAEKNAKFERSITELETNLEQLENE